MPKFAVDEQKRSEMNLLNPFDVQIPPFTGRHFERTAEQIQARAKSMHEDGQLQPIGVVKLPDGKPEAVFGFTRLLAGRYLRDSGIDPNFMIEVKTLTMKEAKDFKLATIRENTERNNVNDIDHAYNQAELRELGMSQTEIAEAYGWDVAKVSRLKKLLKLAEPVQRLVASGELATASAVLLSDLPEPEQLKLIVEEKKYKIDEIKEYLRNRQEKPADQPTPPTEQQPGSSEASETPTDSNPDEAPSLDFTKVGDGKQPIATPPEKTADAPPSPPKRKFQRSLMDVKELLDEYSTPETHPVLAAFSNAILAYIHGEITKMQFEEVIRKMEGKKPDPKVEPPAMLDETPKLAEVM